MHSVWWSSAFWRFCFPLSVTATFLSLSGPIRVLSKLSTYLSNTPSSEMHVYVLLAFIYWQNNTHTNITPFASARMLTVKYCSIHFSSRAVIPFPNMLMETLEESPQSVYTWQEWSCRGNKFYKKKIKNSAWKRPTSPKSRSSSRVQSYVSCVHYQMEMQHRAWMREKGLGWGESVMSECRTSHWIKDYS